jgi:hypothetical protein
MELINENIFYIPRLKAKEILQNKINEIIIEINKNFNIKIRLIDFHKIEISKEPKQLGITTVNKILKFTNATYQTNIGLFNLNTTYQDAIKNLNKIIIAINGVQ